MTRHAMGARASKAGSRPEHHKRSVTFQFESVPWGDPGAPADVTLSGTEACLAQLHEALELYTETKAVCIGL